MPRYLQSRRPAPLLPETEISLYLALYGIRYWQAKEFLGSPADVCDVEHAVHTIVNTGYSPPLDYGLV